MPKDNLEKILTDILQIYMNYDDYVIEELLIEPNLARKERVDKIDGLEVNIYSNDHSPLHFMLRQKIK